MDGPKAQWEHQLDMLMQMWHRGDLTAEKLKDLLQAAIGQEVKKPDEQIDMTFVGRCEALIGQVRWGGMPPERSQKAAVWRAVRRQIKRDHGKHPRPVRAAVRFGLAFAMAACLLIFAALLPNGQLSDFITPDEQLYIIQGRQSNMQPVATAIAEPDADALSKKQSADFKEMCDFYGFVPPIPHDIPQDWSLLMYEGYLSQSEWSFLMVLTHEKQAHTVTYGITASNTYDGFGQAYHQNETGITVKLPNGFNGYLAYNLGDILIAWTDGLTIYDVAGPISQDEAMEMIDSIR